MRTPQRRVWLAVMITACIALSGCPSGCDQISKILNPTGTSVQSVTVSPTLAQVTVGQSMQFTATVLPTGVADRSVTWTVTPTGTATIDTNGIFSALTAGQAVVTATSVSTPVHIAQAAVTIVAPQ